MFHKCNSDNIPLLGALVGEACACVWVCNVCASLHALSASLQVLCASTQACSNDGMVAAQRSYYLASWCCLLLVCIPCPSSFFCWLSHTTSPAYASFLVPACRHQPFALLVGGNAQHPVAATQDGWMVWCIAQKRVYHIPYLRTLSSLWFRASQLFPAMRWRLSEEVQNQQAWAVWHRMRQAERALRRLVSQVTQPYLAQALPQLLHALRSSSSVWLLVEAGCKQDTMEPLERLQPHSSGGSRCEHSSWDKPIGDIR